MKKILICLLMLLVSFCIFADDFDFDDFDSFDDYGSFDDLSAQESVVIGGMVSTDFRYFLGDEESPVKVIPAAKISFSFDADKVGFTTVFDVNEDKLKNNPVDILDEVVLHGYFGNFNVEMGKTRVVWGKGDGVHVLDNFNADNYSDFLIPDYIDRRISIPMVRTSYSVPNDSNLNFEAVYTPFIVKNHYNTEGSFVPKSVSELNSVVNGAAQEVLVAYNPVAIIQAQKLSEDSDNVLYPNLLRLKYSQFGVRMTGTAGRFDWGVSYYNGYYKQPSVNPIKLANWCTNYFTGSSVEKFLEFDRKQTFGLEGATTLWHFNLRGEFAFNLTEDHEGNKPFVHNNSIEWLAGFDIDLPFWNMNLNLQEMGSFVLDKDDIKNNTASLSVRGLKDIDYNANGFLQNRLIADISASFVHDKLKPELKLLWCVESHDFVMMPVLSYDLTQSFNVSLKGLYVWCKDNNSQFKGYDNNDFVQLSVSYRF